MGAARKCDRCGKCFDPLTVEGEMVRFINPIFQTRDSIRECKVYRRLLTVGDPQPGYERGDIMVDLCPKCTEAFKMFMEGRINGYNSTDDVFENVNRLHDPLFDIGRAACKENKENKNNEL